MDQILATLYAHDRQLMILGLSVCVFGAITSVRVLQLAAASTGSRRTVWLLAASLVSGCTVWATHFIAMLAFDPGVPVAYDFRQTAASLAIGVAFSLMAFALLVRREVWVPYVAGVLFAAGVAGIHYVGMGAMQLPGRVVWNPDYVALSIFAAVLFGVIALSAVRRLPTDRGLLSGSVAIVCAALIVYFAGISAVAVAQDLSTEVQPGFVPEIVLAYGAAILTCFVLTIALLCVVFDARITRGKAEAESKLRHLADHDALTGLPNRRSLGDELRRRIDEARLSGGELAILAVDLDRFKQVNDIFGHQAGDGLLRALSDTMRGEIRDGEFLARVGGDEFVIVQSGLPQPQAARDLAQRLLDAVCREVTVEGITFRSAASVGIALYPRDGKAAEILHPNADAALYRAKQDGRSTFRFFEAEMDMALRERRALQMEMRDALKRGEFRLFYQPQAETMTGVISGLEALLRWDHPRRGLVNPMDFVPAAEENGFIVELGEFVLRAACAEAASWTNPLNIAVNLSPVQFQHGDLVALVEDALKGSGLAPGRLELEITESVLIDDMGRALDILRRLKDLGVCIAMDDFGTGYSSLAYLQAFPFDRIKIDRSFVAGLDNNKQSEAIIRAVVGLGRGLNVPVTAEGVETEAQQTFLAELDCAEIQGYLIGKPLPIEQLEMHVGRRKGDTIRKITA